MAKNKFKQFTSTRPIKSALSKRLMAIANDEGIKLKAMVRDELEDTLRHEVYASYRPATKQGQETQDYNETHKHQKTRPYHHTGLLARSIYAITNDVGAEAMVRDEEYDNGSSTTEVYDYLKFGTTNNPKTDTYDYAGGTKFSKYIPQDPHNFEARTRQHMDVFLDNLDREIESNGINKINPKYLKKLRKSDR